MIGYVYRNHKAIMRHPKGVTQGVRKAYATARVGNTLTVREDATVNEREQAWFNLTETLMKDFNREMESNIRKHLVNWIK